MKKKILNLIFLFILIVPAFVLCGCGSGDSGGDPQFHDRTKWFTETELVAVGLSNLSAPIGLTGEISSSDSWFNDGYSFSQQCKDESLLAQNAEIYLNYFKSNYNGYFGVANTYMTSPDAFYYKISQKENIADYFDDNPSKLYKFYYVTNKATNSEGYFVSGSVYTFEICYEFSTSLNQYMFKLFIEKADLSHNQKFSYYYKMG